MKPVVKRYLGTCDADVQSINRLLVTVYLRCKGIEVDNGSRLTPYVMQEGDDGWSRVEEFYNVLRVHYPEIKLEDLIDFFEFVVSPSDKVVTGAIYTPQRIRRTIVDHVFQLLKGRDYATLRVADIACGCGGFFLTVCEKILSETELDCHYICENILYGCDIENYCIERSKILLALKALECGERTDDLSFNLYPQNSLVFDWHTVIPDFYGFDAIVGNPPYVTSAKMDAETRSLLCHWEVCNSGKADLYIPFFQIAIELLSDIGVLGYITVSNFQRSLNGKALREYFAKKQRSITIVDFGGEQVFKGCSTYTCLFFTENRQGGVRYVRTSSIAACEIERLHFVDADYKELNATKGWVIKDGKIDDILHKIENAGSSLGDVVTISNGIATLKNDLYVLNIVGETENEFIHEYDGVCYPIEREICRQVVKPSAMDVNTPVENQVGWIIFPYTMQGKRPICYNESQMERIYPNSLAYLRVVRPLLEKRDKGKRGYEQWYAYGRSQAINTPGYRLLMPYIADKPTFMLSNLVDLIYYNGFALLSNDIQQLERLKKILNTDIFWFYVKNISKPYANGYYSMGKRYIRYFGIPNFTEEQLQELDNITEREDVERWLYPCYFGEDAENVKNVCKV